MLLQSSEQRILDKLMRESHAGILNFFTLTKAEFKGCHNIYLASKGVFVCLSVRPVFASPEMVHVQLQY